eukprot:CAMPEP_0168537840 /NCGR_PEP_ID=MMETSP0405-20121227/20660_1 /TAXON_ID=498012 /ORGANISM="Trichosphaerium sp, Strain Am-I-7 wt" /LENGTH=204 /DNA_ID=CAMNT_0008566665 /DNA_START=123 /DNA_END=733 /DNA_ORIENTATION=-
MNESEDYFDKKELCSQAKYTCIWRSVVIFLVIVTLVAGVASIYSVYKMQQQVRILEEWDKEVNKALFAQTVSQTLRQIEWDSLNRKISTVVEDGILTVHKLSKCPEGWVELENSADRFLMGAGSSELGELGGEKQHRLTIQEMPSHSHNPYVTSPRHKGGGISGWVLGNGGPSQGAQQVVNAAGEGKPHNNLPPYVTVKFCVKV